MKNGKHFRLILLSGSIFFVVFFVISAWRYQQYFRAINKTYDQAVLTFTFMSVLISGLMAILIAGSALAAIWQLLILTKQNQTTILARMHELYSSQEMRDAVYVVHNDLPGLFEKHKKLRYQRRLLFQYWKMLSVLAKRGVVDTDFIFAADPDGLRIWPKQRILEEQVRTSIHLQEDYDHKGTQFQELPDSEKFLELTPEEREDLMTRTWIGIERDHEPLTRLYQEWLKTESGRGWTRMNKRTRDGQSERYVMEVNAKLDAYRKEVAYSLEK